MDAILKKCKNLTDNEKKLLNLKVPRELSENEKQQIASNLKKATTQHLFFNKTYEDLIVDFICNPITKSLLFCVSTVLVMIILRELGIMKFLFNTNYIELYVVVVLVFSVIIYQSQKNLNDNIIWMMERLPENATYADYLYTHPKADVNYSIFNTLGVLILTTIVAGIIEITKKNKLFLKMFR